MPWLWRVSGRIADTKLHVYAQSIFLDYDIPILQTWLEGERVW